MKTLRILAAAALLCAAANAAYADVTPEPESGDGDAFLTIVNTALNTSVVIDLNTTLSSLIPTSQGGTVGDGFTAVFNLSPEVTTFLMQSASTAYSWWVAAADSIGTGTFNGRRLLTTGGFGAAAPNITNQFVQQASGAAQTFVDLVNGQCAAAGPCFAVSGDNAYAGNRATGFEWDTRWNNQLPIALNNGAAALGGAQGFFYYASNSNTASLPATRAAYANSLGQAASWLLELVAGGPARLTFSVPQAIPLPAAVWLLLSALVGLATVGRRRQGGALPV